MLKLKIPSLVIQQIFPSQNLSINNFIAFKLSYSVTVPGPDFHFHTSDQQPDALPDALQDLLFLLAPPPSLNKCKGNLTDLRS
jgi:hypothetical protein